MESERLPTPKFWETSKETPTIHRIIDAEGKTIDIMVGTLSCKVFYIRRHGNSWSELKPVGDWGGIVVMGSLVQLKSPGHYPRLVSRRR